MKPRSEIRFTGLNRHAHAGPKWFGLLTQLWGARADHGSVLWQISSSTNQTPLLNHLAFLYLWGRMCTRVKYKTEDLFKKAASSKCASDERPVGVFQPHSSPVPWWSGLWFTGSWIVFSKTSCLTKFFSTALQGDSQYPWAPSSI